jgi:hypothetical protein
LCAALVPFKKIYREKRTTALFAFEPLNKSVGEWPCEEAGIRKDLFSPNICEKEGEKRFEREAISFSTSTSKGEMPGVSFLLIGEDMLVFISVLSLEKVEANITIT